MREIKRYKARGGWYSQNSQRFDAGVMDRVSRTLKAEKHDACVICKVRISDAQKKM